MHGPSAPKRKFGHLALLLVVLSAPVFALSAPVFATSQTDLDTVLAKMDQAASKFRTAQADFSWTMFNSVVNEMDDKETGKIYFERSGNQTKMAADILTPEKKEVVFSGGKIEIYQPKLDTVDVYDPGAHREEFETFLVLGFGSSGEEMRKSFEVKYVQEETIDAVSTAKLELTPKAENIKQHFPQIVLWIDLQRGVSVQQKLVEANESYRLAKYSNIQLDQKIPERVFKIKMSNKTKTVNHQ